MAAHSAVGVIAGGSGLVRSVASIVSLASGVALLASSLLALGPFATSRVQDPGSGPASGGIASGAGAGASIIPPPTFPVAGVASETPTPSDPPITATSEPTVAAIATPVVTPPPPATQPPAVEQAWFADAFDEPGGWPTGAAEFYTAGVVASTYVVEPKAVDLPVYLWAPTDGGPGRAATIEATVDLRGEPSLKAGVAFGDRGDATRIALFVHASGAWELVVDDAESYRTVLYGASGAFVDGPNHLQLRVSAAGTEAWLNGRSLGWAPATVDIGFVGLGVQALDGGGRATVDDVSVTVPR